MHHSIQLDVEHRLRNVSMDNHTCSARHIGCALSTISIATKLYRYGVEEIQIGSNALGHKPDPHSTQVGTH